MGFFYFLRGEANELCDLNILGKVDKQLVPCIKGYLVRLFAKDEKGFDFVIALCLLGPLVHLLILFIRC